MVVSYAMYVGMKLITIFSASFIAILIGILPLFPDIVAQQTTKNGEHNKAVIINFDDGHKSQYTDAKPILDKYGFKATFYVVCNYIGNKQGYMDWKEVETLHKEGHDIGSHSMSHVHLSKLSKKNIKYEVGQSKKCLQDHGIEATSFAYPFNDGSYDKNILDMVSKYYEIARTGNDPITYLRCDGLKEQSNQTQCRINTHSLRYANIPTTSGWSHDFSRMSYSFGDLELFEKFIQVVNAQDKYNVNGVINAVPIIIYHRVGTNSTVDYNTDSELFDKEMKYLHDNNFTVLTMDDLAYDNKLGYIYIKEFEPPEESGIIAKVDSYSQSDNKGP